MSLEITLFSIFIFFFIFFRLPLYFVVPICVSDESILKYEGRGIPVSIYAWLRVRNLTEKTKFQLALQMLLHIFRT